MCERLLAEGNDILCADNFYSGTKDNVAHLMGNPHFELMRHDVTFPLYVEVDQIYNLACPASPESRAKAIPFWNHDRNMNGLPGHAALLDWPYKLHTDPAAGRRASQQQNDGEKIPSVLLYDVPKDPKETTDLAAHEPERVKNMSLELNAWKRSVDKSLSGADYASTPKR